MRSTVKPRLLSLLLDGAPHTEQELAERLGFRRVETIRHAIRSFENAGYITRKRNPDLGWACQLVCTYDIALRIYDARQFAPLRPQVRNASWFVPLFTGDFERLPAGLPAYIRRMVQDSHSFFLVIRHYSTPEKVRETFQALLFAPRLFGCQDNALEDYLLYYTIFIQSVIRDVEYGGLGEGFTNTIAGLKDCIRALHAGKAHGHGGKTSARADIGNNGVGSV
jgi:hypothetical protein